MSSIQSRLPSLTLVAKGDPESNTIGDCPFCHRVLLTLAVKVRAQRELCVFSAWSDTPILSTNMILVIRD